MKTVTQLQNAITSVLPWIVRPESVFRDAGLEPRNYTQIAFNKRFGPGHTIGASLEMLLGTLPALMNNLPLINDCYWTPNSFFGVKENSNHKVVSLPLALRAKRQNLQWLNTCFLDLDIYKGPRPIDPYTAEAELFRMANRGHLPTPSIVAHSGRGLYVFWLLRNSGLEDQHCLMPPLPEKATEQAIKRAETINRRLAESCGYFSPDDSAFNASHWLRLPGSIHTGAQRQVLYKVSYSDTGVIYYTLDELERELDISSGLSKVRRPTKAPGTAPNRVEGYKARYQKALHILKQMELAWGGIKKRGDEYDDGSKSKGRRNFLTDLARFSKAGGNGYGETLALCQQYARRCKPPYPSDTDDSTVESIVDRAFTETVYRVTDKRVLEHHGFSLPRAQQLGITGRWKAKSSTPKEPKKAARERRHSFMRAYHSAHREQIISSRDWVSICEQNGIQTSQTTARKDLKALGLNTHDACNVVFLGMPAEQLQELYAAQSKLEQRRMQVQIEKRRR